MSDPLTASTGSVRPVGPAGRARTAVSTAGRALTVLAGSACVLGAASPLAMADGLDAGHMSLNQGASCALGDVNEVGQSVVTTGALPKAFNDVDAGSDRTDGVKALCHAVKAAPPAAHPGVSRQGRGLLGGMPLGGR